MIEEHAASCTLHAHAAAVLLRILEARQVASMGSAPYGASGCLAALHARETGQVRLPAKAPSEGTAQREQFVPPPLCASWRLARGREGLRTPRQRSRAGWAEVKGRRVGRRRDLALHLRG